MSVVLSTNQSMPVMATETEPVTKKVKSSKKSHSKAAPLPPLPPHPEPVSQLPVKKMKLVKRLKKNESLPVKPTIKHPSFKRLARKSGIKRLSNDAYDKINSLLENYVKSIVKSAVSVTKHADRNTVTTSDVLFALNSQQKPLYI